ncbi:MAG TPA: twin-arginine translocation signal domain-containing protein, partial [Tepidisphaeraceae bacterium]|nr:twin-arginine translocation signal domain-containing protein [Tepidisphaeraceae bacterium]
MNDLRNNSDSSNQEITRRRVLKVLGASAVAVTLGGTMGKGQALAAGDIKDAAASAGGAKQAIPRLAEPFDLADVRLLDGPFKNAQERDG